MDMQKRQSAVRDRSNLPIRSCYRYRPSELTRVYGGGLDRHWSKTWPLTIVACCFIAFAGPVLASELEGRWQAEAVSSLRTIFKGRPAEEEARFVLDLGPCGTRYCGWLVTPENGCGPTVFVGDAIFVADAISVGSTDNNTLVGSLELPGHADAYKAVVTVQKSDASTSEMRIYSGDKFRPIFSRRMPFEARLRKIGDSVCVATKLTY